MWYRNILLLQPIIYAQAIAFHTKYRARFTNGSWIFALIFALITILTIQFWTCHDSSAVVTCVKLEPDGMIIMSKSDTYLTI